LGKKMLMGGSNGQLLDLLVKGISKDGFGERIRKALGSDTESSEGAQAGHTVADGATPQAAATPSVLPAAAPAATANTLRQEREARTKAKGKQRQADPPEPVSPETAPTTAARHDWLEQQRQRQIDARRERERVMAQIEADKAERRARREQERKAREQAAVQMESKSSPFSPQSRNSIASRSTFSKLQVRLLDGGTIRKQFPAEALLETDVRPWIDSHLETKAPYTFKQILAPQPAKAISVSEEHSSLRDLDLLPSATLVLQPVQTYSDAYAPSSDGLLSLPYNAVTGAVGLVTDSLSGAARWLRGGLFRPEDGNGGIDGHTLGEASQHDPADQDPKQDDSGPAPRAASRSNVRIRTLADQRVGSVDQQFYNGNSLDFEPNADESASR
jgi:hypothetical protein